MRKIFLGIIITAFVGSIAAQENNIWYFDKDWNPCHKSKAKFFRTVDSTDAIDVFIVSDWYGDSNMQMVAPFRLTDDYINWGLAEVSQKNDKGYPMDSVVWYYQNGQMDAICYFRDGLQHGAVKGWYEDGLQERTGWFKEDEQDSTWHYYYEDGSVQNIQYFDNGLKTGEWLAYFENGNTEYEASYANDELNGTYFGYYEEEGGIWMEKMFRDGLKHGEAKEFYENGQMSLNMFFDNDEANGKYIEYYDSGAVKAEGQFELGDESGLWILYHEDGQILSRGSYVEDQKNGLWQVWHTNGKMAFEGEYINGKENGKHKRWNSSGKLISKEKYSPVMSLEEKLVEKSDSVFMVEPHWNMEDAYHIKMTSVVNSYENGEKTSDWSYEKNILFEVIDSSAKYYYFKWKYLDYKSLNTPTAFSMYADFYPGLELLVQMTRNNGEMSIYNWDAVKKVLEEAIDKMVRARGGVISKEEIDNYKIIMLNRYSMEPTILREISEYFMYLNKKITAGKIELSEKTGVDEQVERKAGFELKESENEGWLDYAVHEELVEKDGNNLAATIAWVMELPEEKKEITEYARIYNLKNCIFSYTDGHVLLLRIIQDYTADEFNTRMETTYEAVPGE